MSSITRRLERLPDLQQPFPRPQLVRTTPQVMPLRPKPDNRLLAIAVASAIVIVIGFGIGFIHFILGPAIDTSAQSSATQTFDAP